MIEWSLLRAAFERFDPVPNDVRLAAEAAAGFVGSTTALPAVAGLRGEQVARFAGAAGRVTVEIEPGRLTGVAEGIDGALWVRWPGGERAIVLRDGCFSVDGLPAGPVSFAVRRAGSPDAVTPWFVA